MKKENRRWWVATASFLLLGSPIVVGCGSDQPAGEAEFAVPTSTASTSAKSTSAQSTSAAHSEAEETLLVGAEVLADDDYAALAGQRVGVILNQASAVHGEPLLDVLADSEHVDLVAAFGPEHGVRGEAPAGAAVADSIDRNTGVAAYSLYGETRAPTSAMLADVDVLVFDLQDVGARFYTYISTLGLAMQAAAVADLRFVVLDRPNPLGGLYLDGFVRDEAHESFVGQYPIPAVHGMTTGELAVAIKGEGWLPGLDSLNLEVIPMQGWHRDRTWTDLDLDWVPPSPSLPSATSATIYPGTVLFEATSLSVGRGTDEPFAVVGAPWVDGAAVTSDLNELGLPGVEFEPAVFVPEASDAVPRPPYAGEQVDGVRVVPTDGSFRSVETGVHLLAAFLAHAKDQGIGTVVDSPQFLDLLAGTDVLRLGLDSGVPTDELIARWSVELGSFDAVRQPYLLYD